MAKKNINVELLRIIGTIQVVSLHVFGFGGILQNIPADSVTYWGAWFLEICAYCAVNIFAMISGYVMVGKRVKLRNIIGLWFQVFFYSVLIAVVVFAFVPEARSVKNLVIALFPVMGRQWWYVSAYFGLLLFIPILNAAIDHVSQEVYRNVLVAILFVMCTANRIIPLDTFGLSNGYSLLWLLIMYLFGAYIKKYELQRKTAAAKGLWGYFVAVALTFLSKIIIYYVTKLVFGQPDYDSVFVSYHSVTIVLATVCLFLFGLNINMNSAAEKVVCFFAPVSLSVYLIQTHQLVYKFVLDNVFAPFALMPLGKMFLWVVIAVLAIYLCCAAVDLLRIQLFKLFRVSKLCMRLEEMMLSLYGKLFVKQSV